MDSGIKVGILAIVITAVLTAAVVATWMDAAKRSGQIVIPAGNTYLGPNTPSLQKSTTSSVFTVSADAPWHDVRGSRFPYVISVPESLKLVSPAGDNPYDLQEISWGSYDPASAVLIGVDANVSASQSKESYVRSWWKQFSGLKGVTSVDAFTNSHGMKGYKAKYINGAGETPNLDVFFEVPGNATTIIHLANGILDLAIFDKIVDSVRWQQ